MTILDIQDFVDNTVHKMMETLAGRKLDWQMEAIGEVRDVTLEMLERVYSIPQDTIYPESEENKGK